MLDFSLSELAVVGTIALVVLGPERLPVAARTAGRWLTKARRFSQQIQQELTSQLDAEELRREFAEQRRTLDQQMQETRQALAQVQHDVPTSARSSASAPQPVTGSIENEDNDISATGVKTHPSISHDSPRPVIAAAALHRSSSSTATRPGASDAP